MRMTKYYGANVTIQNQLARCLQAFSVFYIVVLQLTFFFSFWPILLFFTRFWWVTILYGIWLLYDYRAPQTGGYSESYVRWWRKNGIHQYFSSYFPSYLHKTADLPKGNNYLIVTHPHGILALGAYSSYCTDSSELYEKFVGFTVRHATLGAELWTALRREVLMLHGYVSCSKESLTYMLDAEKNANNIVVLVVGGVAESLNAHPGTHVLTLKTRKGFARIALETGAHLVPQYTFGENDLYQQVKNPQGSTLRKIQEFAKKRLSFTLPLFYGRGLVFQNTLGLMPHRKRLDTVVGAPIPVTRTVKPTAEEVDRLHKKYMEALEKLFEENKAKFGVPPEQRLIFQ